EARDRDAETFALASTAAYAGDADPYVKPRDLDADADADADAIIEIDDDDPDLGDAAELGGAR
ncbi:MAG TPA: ribosome-binding factor A, partial [Agromyces sp.]